MNCRDFREHMLDLAAGNPPDSEVRNHMESCSACAAEVASFRSTMALLDEWHAPEDTSPYFMTRLRARLREEQERAPAGLLGWFRRPALALGITTLLVAVSVGLFEAGNGKTTGAKTQTVDALPARAGTAVGDLQYLNKNADLFANFELLDDIDNAAPNSN